MTTQFVVEFKPDSNDPLMRPTLNPIEAEALPILCRRVQQTMLDNGINEAVIYMPVRIVRAARTSTVCNMQGKTVSVELPLKDEEIGGNNG